MSIVKSIVEQSYISEHHAASPHHPGGESYKAKEYISPWSWIIVLGFIVLVTFWPFGSTPCNCDQSSAAMRLR